MEEEKREESSRMTEVKAVQQDVREWSSGVFSCFDDMASCICGLCCIPCLTCRVAERMNEPCHICLGCCLFPEAILALRIKLRTQFGVKGDLCNDILCTVLCMPCVLCQTDREMKTMGM